MTTSIGSTGGRKESQQLGFIAGPLAKDALRDVFRLITARQNSLTEVYPKEVFVSPKDIDELNQLLCDKFQRYHSCNRSFSALISYTNFRALEIPDWNAFTATNWSVPEMVDSATLRWEFLVQFEDGGRPNPFKITLRCGRGLRPSLMLQYMMSRDDEEIDHFEIMSAPMSCKIDFSDQIVSQEILDLVARWHKARRRPESLMPALMFFRKNHEPIATAIKVLTPVFTFFLILSVLFKTVHGVDSTEPVTNAFLASALVWLCGALALSAASVWISRHASEFVTRQLLRVAMTHSLEFTNGDRNQQVRLFAASQRSFIKFIASGGVAILWNMAAALLALKWLPMP